MPPARITEACAEERLVAIFAEQFGVDKTLINRSTSFDDLGADSLDTVELTMEIEEEFDFTIPDADAEKLFTLGQYLAYVVKHA